MTEQERGQELFLLEQHQEGVCEDDCPYCDDGDAADASTGAGGQP